MRGGTFMWLLPHPCMGMGVSRPMHEPPAATHAERTLVELRMDVLRAIAWGAVRLVAGPSGRLWPFVGGAVLALAELLIATSR